MDEAFLDLEGQGEAEYAIENVEDGTSWPTSKVNTWFLVKVTHRPAPAPLSELSETSVFSLFRLGCVSLCVRPSVVSFFCSRRVPAAVSRGVVRCSSWPTSSVR